MICEASSRFPGNDSFQRNVEFTVMVHQVVSINQVLWKKMVLSLHFHPLWLIAECEYRLLGRFSAGILV